MKKKLLFLCIICIFIFSLKINAYAADLDCNVWGKALQDMNNVFDFIKIIIPLLIIGLSTYDFIKAITQKDDKDIKKAFTRLLKRLIYAVIFFFLPMLIELFLNMIIDTEVCIG